MSDIVPEGWEETNLSTLVSVDIESIKGNTDPEYKFKYIDISCVSTGSVTPPSQHILFQNAPSRAKRIVRQNDVLIATVRPNLKAFAHFDEEGEDWVASTGFAVLRNKEWADSRFIFNVMLSDDVSGQIDKLVAGSNYPAINSSDVKNLTVLSPPLPEQKKIASILTSVDEVIETTQRQIDKLQDLKKATMNELLTKGIGHTEFKDSELGRIPKSWEVRLLSEVTVKIGDGIHATPKYSESGKYPFINGNNLENGRIVINNSTKTVDHLEFEKQRTDLGQKTLLISINGTIGNLAFYNGEEVVLGKSAAYLTFLDNVNLSYAYYLLGSEPLRKHFHDELTGTTIKNLSLKSIRSTPIPTPPISEQIEISSVVTSIDKKITAHQQKLSKTQSLKKSLMQDLLTGKVRVQVN